MKIEEYISRKKELKNKIALLNEELGKLNKEYIEANSKYPIGTKLKCTYKNSGIAVVGVVKYYDINCSTNKVTPVLAALKKDGTAHKTKEAYVSWWAVEKVETIK